MPSYARFMKGILSRKVKLDDLETIALTEECSVVLQQKLPPKLKDPGSFTIPCTIGNLSFDKCLSVTNPPNVPLASSNSISEIITLAVSDCKREVEEQVNAITLRSGKVASPKIQQDEKPEKSQVSENAVVAEEEVQKEAEVEPRKTILEHTSPEGNIWEIQIYPPPPFPKRL
ncbi:hypothetical protein AgCh_023884 [Apium graveolens]